MINKQIRQYFSFDLATLGLGRVVLGLTLLSYWALRIVTSKEYLSNYGHLPNHYNIYSRSFAGFSVLNAFSSPIEVTLIMLLFGGLFLLFTLGIGGWGVRFATFLAAVSILNRNLSIENGGHVVLNILLLWSLFLPVMERFTLATYKAREDRSVKNWLKLEMRPESYIGIGTVGVLSTVVCIYLFNYLSKTGVTWQTGSALHYTLWLSSRAFYPAFLLREYLPSNLLYLLSKSVLSVEGLIPFLVLSPICIYSCRRVAALFILVLHLSIALCINLGPFSYAMCVLAIWIWPMTRSQESDEVVKAKTPSLVLYLSIVLGALFIYTFIVQSLFVFQGWMGHPVNYPPPKWTTVLVEYLRVPQNWRMFSVDAPSVSNAIVRVGVNGTEKINLDTGALFDPNLQSSLDAYFEAPLGHHHLRIESDTRIAHVNGDFQRFFLEYLRRAYPGYDNYQAIELTRTSPPFGSSKYEQPATARLLFESRK